MPICEADPWRRQYFEHAPCPENVFVPTEDCDCWTWNPNYRWVYNKLAIAESQGLECAPHGVDPDAFPVFSKPIYNLHGMGAGSHVLRSLKEYTRLQRPGHFWMTLLQGEHVSTDIAVVNGEAKWWRHATGEALEGGVFDYWTVHAAPKPELEEYCGAWLRKHLPGYTGMVNCETIGGRIIEMHLRFADQWPDLYGNHWVEALVRLYAEKRWEFDDSERREGYSVVLFGAHGVQFRYPPADLVEEIRRMPGVTSVQITFHEDWPLARHSMPPGGFRLAIVNGWNLETGRRARKLLALSFWSAQKLAPRRGRHKAGALDYAH
ncbi:MAG: hypothetical protein ACRETQ_07320 [Gammaproteobacteria bacterium]